MAVGVTPSVSSVDAALGAASPGGGVARRLLALLASETLRDGDRIPSERALTQALGVPRSVVREALRSLTLIGLLNSQPGRGTYICAADSEWVATAIEWGLMLGLQNTIDLVEARTHLEVLSAELAAERRDEYDIAQLSEIVDRMRAFKTEREELTRLDIAFHIQLAQASKSGVLAHLLEHVEFLLEVWIARVLDRVAHEDLQSEMLVEHAAVLEAVAASDSQLAGSLMASAMRVGEQHLREALQLSKITEAIAAPIRRPGVRPSGSSSPPPTCVGQREASSAEPRRP